MGPRPSRPRGATANLGAECPPVLHSAMRSGWLWAELSSETE